MTDPRVLAAVLRADFAAFATKVFRTLEPGTPFLPNWHQDALAYHLDQVRTGKLKRLVINLPPRSAKSIYASVALCAFWHGHDPSKKIACVSYAGELTGKLMRDYRTILNSDWYRQLFPATRIGPEKNTESEIHLTARGCRLAWPITGTITGRGADLIIVDDPIKAEDAFSETIRNGVNERFDGTILSRLDQKAHAAVVVVMQRFHPEDLSGHVLSQPGWTHLRLPAIAEAYEVVQTGADTVHIRQKGEALHPEREPLELLQKEKATIGEMRFSAQYQQSPVPPEGNLIKWAWFERYEIAPEHQRGRIVQSWDTAGKVGAQSAYTACLTFLRLDNHHYLLNVLRDKLDYPSLRRTVAAHAAAWRAADILIEDAALGMALIQDLRSDPAAPQPIAIRPEGDKLNRMAHAASLIEARSVFLPKSADWLDAFRAEVLQFRKRWFQGTAAAGLT